MGLSLSKYKASKKNKFNTTRCMNHCDEECKIPVGMIISADGSIRNYNDESCCNSCFRYIYN